MTIVTEILSGDPVGRPSRTMRREESGLFEAPPERARPFIGDPPPPLAVYNFPVTFTPMPFAPPRGVFEGPTLRLEWQLMDGRQPFYHRNADVDEIGYQICGERTLMTECGTIEFEPGQFARIPLGAAHDNFGRADIHLIFYMHGPAEACVAPVSHGEHRLPPFADWAARPQVEALTNCLGGPHCTIGYSMADEELLLAAAIGCADPLEILEPSAPAGELEWIYKAPRVWIGHTRLEPTAERRYLRHLAADEIQFQAEGTRTIVSQHGVVTVSPGDFVRIPGGCAFASVCDEASRHLSVLTAETVPAAREPTRFADLDVMSWIAEHNDSRPAPIDLEVTQ